MKKITLRVLDGADKGKTFEEIGVPVTIGREEGNTIQLNDERVSRFHLKIQQDHEDLVLTDLDSTNGSKINNEEAQLRILRHGDLITIGRSTLIFGKRSEISQRMESSRQSCSSSGSSPGESFGVKEGLQETASLALVNREAPQVPDRLSPGQAAQLSELIEFLHAHLSDPVRAAKINSLKKQVVLTGKQWQRIVDAQAHLAEYLQKISNP